MTTPKAFWVTEAGKAEIRSVGSNDSSDLIRVSTLYSGISRGTERLVFRGQVPISEFETMRAPFQEGQFSFPIKYGYSAVGTVETGPRQGEVIFALHPHQTDFFIPSEAAIGLGPDVPPERGVLAANMETALNIVWDAGVRPGDRIAIVGAGVVGALAGYLSARIVGTDVCLIDIDSTKSDLAQRLGCDFTTPDDLPTDMDVVIHASATSEGLATAISVAGLESTIVEASWYGTQLTTAPLGAQFHQKRLRIVSSQVGRIPATMAPRWTYGRRLAKAIEFLSDPALDALISGETAFNDLPNAYATILDDPNTLCHRVRYSQP